MSGYKSTIAALMLAAAATGLLPSSARANEGLINLFGAVIEQGVRQQHHRNQLERQRRIQDERERREQERVIAMIRRIQSDLQTLGFYQGKIDGSFGPNTEGAMMAFQRAFHRASGQLDAQTVDFLAQVAPLGFRSADEMSDALSAGFDNRASYVSAREGGFDTMSEVEAARRDGFRTRADYITYQHSGFESGDDYRAAQKGKFSDPGEFDRARRAGFATRSEFEAFLASGLPDKAAFQKRKAQDARKAELIAACRASRDASDLLKAAIACLDAVVVAPDNADMRIAAAAASGKIGSVADTARAEAHRLRLQIDELKPQARKKSVAREIAGLTRALETSEAVQVRVSTTEQLAACVLAGAEGDWGRAAGACRIAAQASPDNADLRERVLAAEDQIAAAQAAAEAEKKRLALERISAKASEMVEGLGGFSASGAKFNEALEIARLLVRLEEARADGKAEDIELAIRNLQGALDKEAAYAAYLEAKAAAVRQADMVAAEAARSNAERLSGFVQNHVGLNLTSPDVGTLLALHETLQAALTSGDLQALVTAQKAATEQLQQLGLAAAADAYRPVSEAAAAELREDAAALRSNEIALEAARGEAGTVLQRIEAFSAQNGRFAGGLDTVRAIVALKTAAQDETGNGLIEALDGWRVQVAKEPDFLAFVGAQDVVEVNAGNDALVIARQNVDSLLAFIVDYAEANPLAPEVGELLDLQVRLAAGRSAGDPVEVVEAEQRGVAVVEALSLTPSLERFRRGRQERAAPAETASNGLAVTDANRVLLTGDARDILVLVNSSRDAPNVRINLAGERIFDADTALYCWMQSELTPSLGTISAVGALRTAGAVRLVGGESCEGDPGAYDAILMERGPFLAGEAGAAKALVAAFETRTFEVLAEMVWSAQADADKARQALSQQIASDLATGARAGAGLLHLSANDLPVCVVPSESTDATVTALDGRAAEVADLVPSKQRRLTRTAEDAFLAGRRGECSAVLASSEDLARLLAGFGRERIAAMPVPIWIEPSEISEIEARRQAEADRVKQAAVLAEQQREGEARLAREQAERERNSAQARQQALRQRYSQESRAAFNTLDGLAKAHFEMRDGRLPLHFPVTTAWWSERMAADWELEAYRGALLDYGTADWKGRRVEAVLAEISVQSRNRALGEYDERCRVLGFLIDAEFGEIRDPVELECSDPAAAAAWKTGHAFETRWTVEP
jgi:hypothetical protein